MVREQELTDERLQAGLEQLEGKRDDLRELEVVVGPMLVGVAEALRGQGFDDYARRLRELAQRTAAVAKDTRWVIEHLAALTDPRLEQTEPRIPAGVDES